MRPRTQLLLLLRDELDMSYWRFVLDTHGYAVYATTDINEALVWLSEHPDVVQLCATTVAGELGADALAANRPWTKVLLFDVPIKRYVKVQETTHANRVIPQSEGMALAVVDALKTLRARKRGPRDANSRHMEIAKSAAMNALRSRPEAARNTTPAELVRLAAVREGRVA